MLKPLSLKTAKPAVGSQLSFLWEVDALHKVIQENWSRVNPDMCSRQQVFLLLMELSFQLPFVI